MAPNQGEPVCNALKATVGSATERRQSAHDGTHREWHVFDPYTPRSEWRNASPYIPKQERDQKVHEIREDRSAR